METLTKNGLTLRRQNHTKDYKTPEMFYLRTRIKKLFSTVLKGEVSWNTDISINVSCTIHKRSREIFLAKKLFQLHFK